MFQPTRPGTYTFRYEATDLCKTASETTTVVARCPPAPEPKAQVSSAVIYQDQKVILSSEGTKAGSPTTKITKYIWRVLEAPAGSPYEKSVKAKTVLSSGISYDTGAVAVAGQYKFTLSVSDGCSTATTIVCFEVQCNCGSLACGLLCV